MTTNSGAVEVLPTFDLDIEDPVVEVSGVPKKKPKEPRIRIGIFFTVRFRIIYLFSMHASDPQFSQG